MTRPLIVPVACANSAVAVAPRNDVTNNAMNVMFFVIRVAFIQRRDVRPKPQSLEIDAHYSGSNLRWQRGSMHQIEAPWDNSEQSACVALQSRFDLRWCSIHRGLAPCKPKCCEIS